MAADPYQDGDGYVVGPSNPMKVIDMTFYSFIDCDATDITRFAPFPAAGMTGTCGE